jgi:SAM-dependent methyltransferase
VGTVTWGQDIAEAYDAVHARKADPAVVEPMVDVLAGLAGDGATLELAIGTGRVALPLAARGVPVHGIELSAPMVDQLRAKPGADAIPVVIGDMAVTRVAGEFSLVYLVANTIMNLTTQAEQVAVFENAAAHLRPGGCFVVEVVVPQLAAFGPGEPPARVFVAEPGHAGIETLDDPVCQIASSHHWYDVAGRLLHHAAPYRYVWPAELDLMARVAGLALRDRWEDWNRSPFTADSPQQVAVYERPG